MRYHAIAIILLMISASLAGCTSDDTSADNDVDDTVENIGGTTNETVNQTTNDTAVNETTDNTVQYVGFLDNTTVAGYQMNPGGNFSNLGLMDTQRCTDISNGLGLMKEGFCILDYGMMFNFTEAAWVTSIEINETEGCAELYVNDTSEGCLSVLGNISISGRVMWMEYLDHANGPDGVITTSHCLVYIESPAFVPSSQYNRTHNSSSSGVNWDELWADPAYVLWEVERISAYSVEEANAPSWCTTPQFDALYWLTSPADTTPDPEPAQYVGFMDNSSIYGWKINPIENLSRIYIAYSEENCTNKDHGDDWNGTSYSNSICVKDLGQEWGSLGASITHQNGELCVSAPTESACWNMTVSNRVMWLQGDIWGGQEEICSVYIQSERFVPSDGYHLALGAYDANGDYMYPDWDSLLNDPDYTIWNDERMDAYNTESSNAPAWCTDPQFGWIMPASQSV